MHDKELILTNNRMIYEVDLGITRDLKNHFESEFELEV